MDLKPITFYRSAAAAAATVCERTSAHLLFFGYDKQIAHV